jgi:hypothetical protein
MWPKVRIAPQCALEWVGVWGCGGKLTGCACLFCAVGEGGYEEINAVTRAGQNFGWPCWEGPLPHPVTSKAPTFFNETLNRAFLPDGRRFTCDYMFYEVESQLPFYTWTREVNASSTSGYFKWVYFTNQGLSGNVAGGVAVYNGNRYPSWFQGGVFFMDFAAGWIQVAKMGTGPLLDRFSGDVKTIFTGRTQSHTLNVEPITGDICCACRGRRALAVAALTHPCCSCSQTTPGLAASAACAGWRPQCPRSRRLARCRRMQARSSCRPMERLTAISTAYS